MLTLFLLILLFFCIYYRRIFPFRSDGSLAILYEKKKDMPKYDIEYSDVSFYSGKYLLKGAIYKKKKNVSPKATILLFHGVGVGHCYLYNVIKDFVNDGYQVFAYDRHGAGLSEGKKIGDMTSCLKDAKAALEFVKNNPSLNYYPLYFFGHSMGGYTALASLLFKGYNVQKCVSIAGFDKESVLIRGYAPIFTPFSFIRNFLVHGKYSLMSATKAIKTTNTKILHIQSKDDKIVPLNASGYRYEKLSKDYPNLKVVLYEDRTHSPYLTYESQEKQEELYKALGINTIKNIAINQTFDYKEISQNDSKIIKQILDFYNE